MERAVSWMIVTCLINGLHLTMWANEEQGNFLHGEYLVPSLPGHQFPGQFYLFLRLWIKITPCSFDTGLLCRLALLFLFATSSLSPLHHPRLFNTNSTVQFRSSPLQISFSLQLLFLPQPPWNLTSPSWGSHCTQVVPIRVAVAL